MGIAVPTYNHYENGHLGFSDHAPRFAKFFRVSLEWLVTGYGAMRGGTGEIRVLGLVGAGAVIKMLDDIALIESGESINLPKGRRLGAYKVVGDSQYPRFLDGEYVLFDAEPVLPELLIGDYAVVQTTDGQRYIKTLRRGRGDNKWRLESHNAPPLEDVALMGAWRYLGILARARS